MRERPEVNKRRGRIRAVAVMAILIIGLLLAMFIAGNITQATISPTPTPAAIPTSPPVLTITITPVIPRTVTSTLAPSASTTATSAVPTPTPTK